MKSIFLIIVVIFLSGCNATNSKKEAAPITPDSIPTYPGIAVSKEVARAKFIYMFGLKLKSGSEKLLNYINIDFTCDGIPDYFVSAHHLTHFQGPLFETAFVTGHRGIIRVATSMMRYGVKDTKHSLTLEGPGSNPAQVSVITDFKVNGKSSSELVCNKGIYIRQDGEPGYLKYFSFKKDPYNDTIAPVLIDAKENSVSSLSFKDQIFHFTM